MIELELFFGFLKVGCFAFGGAYGAIPLIRDVVLGYGWLDDETLTYMIAVSESTPGPIMVNLATYVGSNQAGFLGAVLATFAVVLFKAVMKNKIVQVTLQGLKPCMIGIVLATGVYMVLKNCLGSLRNVAPNGKALLITAVLEVAMLGNKYFFKKKVSPIALIILSAVLGIAVVVYP